MNSAQPVRLALSPSRNLALLILCLHAAGALCILTVSTAWYAIAAALLLAALGMASASDRALLRSANSPRTIEIRPSGEALCLLADGASAPLVALGGTGVTRAWVALRLGSSRRRSLLVTGGMLPEESFRLLRLWALWGKLPGVALRQLPAGS